MLLLDCSLVPSVEELQRLLNQLDEYDKFFLSLDQTASVNKLKLDLETEAADFNARIAVHDASGCWTLTEITGTRGCY